jgi:uncharacterized protein with PQ loop repeat
VATAPQVIKLLKSHDPSGISVYGWVAALGSNLGWLGHGFLIGMPNVIVPNAAAMTCTLMILYQLHKVYGFSLAARLLPGAALGTVLIVIDGACSPILFGLLAPIPGIVNTGMQAIQLLRAEKVTGVPLGMPAALALNWTVWLAWALVVHDAATTIASYTSGTLIWFNLVWRIARHCGVRPLGRRTAGRLAEPATSPDQAVATVPPAAETKARHSHVARAATAAGVAKRRRGTSRERIRPGTNRLQTIRISGGAKLRRLAAKRRPAARGKHL